MSHPLVATKLLSIKLPVTYLKPLVEGFLGVGRYYRVS